MPRRPENKDIHGYQINRLTLPNPPFEEMRLAANGTIGMSQEAFYRTDLGVPFVTSDARLTPADLDRCRIDYPPALWLGLGPRVWTIAGIDVGNDCFWLVVRMFWNKLSYLIAAERIDGDWEDLAAHLMSKPERLDFVIVDALPDVRGATRFQKMLPAITFMTYYTRKTAHDYSWSQPRTINAARTLALDETFDGFRRERSLLPPWGRELADGAYYQHMQALVRTTEPDEFGQPTPKYVHTKPDDFAHAEAYISLIAVKYGPRHGFWD